MPAAATTLPQRPAPCRSAAPLSCAEPRPRPLRLRVRATAALLVQQASPSNGNGASAVPLNGASLPPVAAAAPAAAPTPAAPVPGVVPPPAVYARVVEGGAAKAAMPWQKVLVMGAMAGVYLGLGGLLSSVVGGNCPGLVASNPGLQKLLVGAFGLPTGLMLVLICGAELFTGNTAFVTAAAIEGKATASQVARSWAASYLGNLAGSVLFVAAVAASGLLVGTAACAPQAVAVAKTSLPFFTAFVRGILCNIFVCLAIWQATAATTLTGKFVGCWLPVSAFAAIGFEHSVANMFLVPLGIALGAPVTVGAFLTANLLPVTLGNMLGGILVALAYGFSYGALGKKLA